MFKTEKLIQNLLLSLTVLVLSLLLVCGAAEIALRLYQNHKYGIGLLNDANHGLLSRDSRLGWRMSPNVHYRVRLQDASQNKYWVDVSTNEYGFRSFGDIHAKRKKILFVGDSFYNTGTPRPYLDLSGNIGYRYATHDHFYWNLPSWISENMRLLKILNTRISRIIHGRSKSGQVSEEIAQSQVTRDAFARSVTVTRMIMERLRQRTGKLPVYLF